MKKKMCWLASIMSMMLLTLTMPLCLTSCGGDDNDNDSGNIPMSSAERMKRTKELLQSQGLLHFSDVPNKYFINNTYVDFSKSDKISLAFQYSKTRCAEAGLDESTVYNGLSGTLTLKEKSYVSGFQTYSVYCDQYPINDISVIFNEEEGTIRVTLNTITLIPYHDYYPTIVAQDLPFAESIKKVIGQWDGGSAEYLDLSPVNGDYLCLSNTSFIESSGHYISIASGSNIHITGVSMGAISGRDANSKFAYTIVSIGGDKMQFTINDKSPSVYTRKSDYVAIEHAVG